MRPDFIFYNEGDEWAAPWVKLGLTPCHTGPTTPEEIKLQERNKVPHPGCEIKMKRAQIGTIQYLD